MSFLHLSVLTAGGLLIAVPVILHLAMRRKPKHQMFPALRFVQQRRTTNQRRLRLRHWLLLALRCLAILSLAAALARPAVASEHLGTWVAAGGLLLLLLVALGATAAAFLAGRGRGLQAGLAAISLLVAGLLVYTVTGALRAGSNVLLGERQVPVAAALVIDTSPRMQYQHENRSRLQQAQQLARSVLRQLPESSEIAVIDARTPQAAFAVDHGAAARAIDSLQIAYATRPLPEVIEEAMRLLQGSQQRRKELYILSDLTRRSWDATAAPASLADAADEGVKVYVLDVGIENPRNNAIADLQLRQQILPNQTPLQLQVQIARHGPAQNMTVALHLEQPDAAAPIVIDGQVQEPTRVVRAQQQVELDENAARWINFDLPGLPVGTHHGLVQIENRDGLVEDDRRYFTVVVRPAWPVLVAAPRDADTRFLIDSLAPYPFRQTGRARFAFDAVTVDELINQDLRRYAAVCLLDPPPLSSEVWQMLQRHVSGGGGLAVFLGRHGQPASEFNSAGAAALMPAPLERQWRAAEGVLFAPTNLDHFVLAGFRTLQQSVPWDALPVFRHWVLGPLAEGAHVICRYGNSKPALLERQVGEGRVLVLTTSISDPPSREPWNWIVSSEVPWPFLVLADRMLRYLVQNSELQLNYLAGQTARLPVERDHSDQRFQLFTPQGDWQEVSASNGLIQVAFADQPGIYRLTLDEASEAPRGFAVNLPADATNLERIAPAAMDGLFGEGNYQLARSEEQLNREIDQTRMGREFYPLLMVMLVVVLGLEQMLANRFYGSESAGG